MNPRHPDWLNDPIPHVDSYMTDENIREVLMSDPEILRTFLSTLGCSLSNQQIRETSNSAARWVDDLNKCEQEEGLGDNRDKWRTGNKMILQWLNTHRTARGVFSITGKPKFRYQ